MKKIYGLLGYPLSHSFSKNYFNDKFASENIDAEYLNFEIPSISEIEPIIAKYPTLNGLNVTIPYKETVIPFLDEMDSAAKIIGAVNVIKFIRTKNGLKLKGYNSDIIGFTDSIAPLLKPHHKKALILGTGGASKAVYYGLESLDITPQYVSRQAKNNILSYEMVTPEILGEYSVIINTTPLGMYPHMDACPDLPYNALTENHLLYDLLYNPDETLFMKKGAEKGATVKNGLEMLLLQAFSGWNIWND